MLNEKKKSSDHHRPENGGNVKPQKTLAGLGRSRNVRLVCLLTSPEQQVRRLGRSTVDSREPLLPGSGLGAGRIRVHNLQRRRLPAAGMAGPELDARLVRA